MDAPVADPAAGAPFTGKAEEDAPGGAPSARFSPGETVREAYKTAFRYLERSYGSGSGALSREGGINAAVMEAYSDFAEYARRILLAAVPHSAGGPVRTAFRKLRSLFMSRRISIDAGLHDIRLSRAPDKYGRAFVKTLVECAADRLDALEEITEEYGLSGDETITGSRNMAAYLRELSGENETEDVFPMDRIPLPSQTLKMDAAYRELYKSWYRLICGLSVINSFRSLDEGFLYGCWCFLKINELLEDSCIPTEQSYLRFRSGGAEYMLGQEKAAAAEFINRAVPGQAVLRYNGPVRPGGTCTIVLEVKDTLRGAERKLVFLPGAEQTGEEGSVVLIPEERYGKGQAGQTVVFSPASTGTVISLLDGAVFGDPLPEGRLTEGSSEDIRRAVESERDVLVGTLRNREQLRACLEGGFYHIPAELVDTDVSRITHVALYQSRRLFGTEAGVRYWGPVTDAAELPRSEIKEIPKESEQPYYRFNIEKWNRLPRAVEVKEVPLNRGYTNTYLLLHSRETPELFVSSFEEYSLFQKLRSLAESPEINENSSLQYFRFGRVTVVSKNGSLFICAGGEAVRSFPLDTILRSPSIAVKAIIETNGRA